ncbi:MAG: glycosyltransferase [Selenomonadaceae bacterium]|nr:glycosyltransferase [Selenomonadaceae bacterium]
MSPRVSVIIPVYNDEQFIEDCLLSLKMQTFQDFEVILIDDCSTDSTFDIVREKFSDPRIKIIRNDVNLKTAESRNRGIELARGEFIFFMDHDDMLAPTALKNLTDYAQEFRADVVHTSIFFTVKEEFHATEKDFNDWEHFKIDEYAKQEDRSEPELMTIDLNERLNINFAQHQTHCTIWMNLYRREFIEKFNLRFFDLVGEDTFFLFETLLTAERFLSIPGGIYIWRKNSQSISHSPSVNMMEKIFRSIDFAARRMRSYFEIFNQIPSATQYNCLKFFIYCHMTDYKAREFYRNDLSFNSFDKMLEDFLNPIFGDRTLLMKTLFHNSNLNLFNLLEADGI